MAVTVKQLGNVPSELHASHHFAPGSAYTPAISLKTSSSAQRSYRRRGSGAAYLSTPPEAGKRAVVSSVGFGQLGQDQASGHMSSNDINGHAAAGDGTSASSKPKRVRTGCLTCRERHLKCDEGMPNCQNCRKSSRVCKRGIRLNFIDTQVQSPPYLLPPVEWNVAFQDESRDIASEYKGGLGKYAGLSPDPDAPQVDPSLTFDYPTNAPSTSSLSNQALPPIQGILPESYEEPPNIIFEPSREQQQQHHRRHQHTHSTTDSTYSTNTLQGTAYGNSDIDLNSDERREYLNSQEEVLFMQVFVEEVGLWMDSMDPMKHVRSVAPKEGLFSWLIFL